jgi:hypothetical protein
MTPRRAWLIAGSAVGVATVVALVWVLQFPLEFASSQQAPQPHEAPVVTQASVTQSPPPTLSEQAAPAPAATHPAERTLPTQGQPPSLPVQATSREQWEADFDKVQGDYHIQINGKECDTPNKDRTGKVRKEGATLRITNECGYVGTLKPILDDSDFAAGKHRFTAVFDITPTHPDELPWWSTKGNGEFWTPAGRDDRTGEERVNIWRHD